MKIISHHQTGGVTAQNVTINTGKKENSDLPDKKGEQDSKPSILRICAVISGIIAFFGSLVAILEFFKVTP